MTSDPKSQRKRQRRKRGDRYFGIVLPENLPAAALEVVGESEMLDHSALCDRLSRVVTAHLVEIVRRAKDRPLRPSELRQIESRLK